MQLTQEQFEYLYLHLDTAEAYNDLNDFFKDYEKDINIANSKSVLLDLDTQLADEDKEAFSPYKGSDCTVKEEQSRDYGKVP